MIVLSELKLNTKKSVSIPSPRELFGRLGLRAKSKGGETGKTYKPQNQSKVEVLKELDNTLEPDDTKKDE